MHRNIITYGGKEYEVLASSWSTSIFEDGVYKGSFKPRISINNRLNYIIEDSSGKTIATYSTDDVSYSPADYAIQLLHEDRHND